MLESIYIKNFALFEEQELQFQNGLTALIGESGSGKSLVLDAISSLMGGRCSATNIRHGAEKYSLQANFSIQDNFAAKEWLQEKGYRHEDGKVTITKELQKDGKSRIFIEDSLASLTNLRELGSHLCEIHNQNEQLFLLDKANQLEFVDRNANLSHMREEMKSAFTIYRSGKRKLLEWEERVGERKNRIESLRYQINELDILKIKPGELEELLKEEKILSHGEKLFESFRSISNYLYEGESSILQVFPQILQSANRISEIHSEFQEISQEFLSIYEQLKELKSSIRDEEEEVFFSPERLDGVQSRMKELLRIKKKYGKDLEDILEDQVQWEKEVEALEDTEESMESIRLEFQSSLERIKSLALDLSRKRRSGIISFEEEIQKELEYLGMKGARIQIVLRWEEDPSGDVRDGEKNYMLTQTGLDQAEFYFSANAGEKPRPLRKVASGGEMSRIMLAIRTVLGKTYSSSKLLVFDEIDSGVGGEGAVCMAERLKKLGKNSQILVVTHSQSIAAAANYHWKVEKNQESGRTVSLARFLKDKEKPLELARMVTGKDVTSAAVAHAKEILLKKAV